MGIVDPQHRGLVVHNSRDMLRDEGELLPLDGQRRDWRGTARPGHGEANQAREHGAVLRRVAVEAAEVRRYLCRSGVLVVPGGQSEAGPEEAPDGVERGRRENLQAVHAQDRGARGRRPLAEILDQPRLADPGLADDLRHHAALLLRRLAPQREKLLGFPLPSDHPRRAATHASARPPGGVARPYDPVEHHIAGQSPDPPVAQQLGLEQPFDKLERLVAHHDGIDRSFVLQAGREVHRLPDNAEFRPAHAEQFRANDEQPAMHADPDRKRRTGFSAGLRFEGGNALDELQRSSHRAFGIILMRGGIAEIDENSVAAVGRYETPVALHRRQPFALVPQLQIPEVFGIHLFRQLRISNQIAEHDRQITPLQSDRRTRAVSFDFHSIPGRRRPVSRAPPSETLAPMVACLQSDRLDEASQATPTLDTLQHLQPEQRLGVGKQCHPADG